jgi:hypothetical protein
MGLVSIPFCSLIRVMLTETGWGIPLIFSLVWTWITVVWVRGALRKEKKMWIGKPRSSMVPREALSH